ncbi:MAG: hypothetical protein WD294_09805 [Phycisphaeraceae bacterium]
MFALLRQIGDALDRIDLAGWTLTLSGMIVVAVTVITPAYLEARQIEAQCIVLRQAATRTDSHYQNYIAFDQALRRNDPLLLERLAWHHLRMRPAGTDAMETLEDPWLVPSVDQWVAPPSESIMIPAEIKLPDSTLVRLITAEPRPWVLAFGAWLILVGLLINPTVASRDDEEDDAADEDEEAR